MVLAVLVIRQPPQWPYSTAPVVGLPTPIRRAIPAGDPVALTYPYASADPMKWPVDDGFNFRLLGGFAFRPSSAQDGHTDDWTGSPRHRPSCRTHRVSILFWHPGRQE
jgi:hypothetical protein